MRVQNRNCWKPKVLAGSCSPKTCRDLTQTSTRIYAWMILISIVCVVMIVVLTDELKRNEIPEIASISTSIYRRQAAPIGWEKSSCEFNDCTIFCRNVTNLKESLLFQIKESKCYSIDMLHIDRHNFENGTIQNNWMETGIIFHEIMITNSNLTQIEDEALASKDFASTFSLYLEDLPLKRLDGSTLLGLPSLSYLSIKGPIENISRVFFQPVRNNLKFLKMSGMTSQIQFDGIFGFNNMTALDHLDLSYNNFIEPITRNGLLYLSKVHFLQLSHSRIRTIGKDAFGPIKNTLRILDLSNNELTKIDYNTFDSILGDRRVYVYLWNNYWSCDCNLKPLLAYYRNFSEVFMEEPICKTPRKYYGESINKIKICDAPSTGDGEDHITTRKTSLATTLKNSYDSSKENVTEEPPSTEGNLNETIITYPNTELLKLACFQPMQDIEGRISHEDVLDYLYIHPPQYEFNISLISGNCVNITVSNYKEKLVIIWYSDPDEYNTEIISDSEYGCRIRDKSSVIISDLNDNVSYTFCLIPVGEESITPFNCLPFHIPVKPKFDDTIWIRQEYKQVAIGAYCLTLFICAILGGTISYCLIKFNPDLLKGSKRVLMVKKSIDSEISTISKNEYLCRDAPSTIRRKRLTPPPSYEQDIDDEEISYETPIHILARQHHSESTLTALDEIEESCPKSPPPLPKRNSEPEPIYGKIDTPLVINKGNI